MKLFRYVLKIDTPKQVLLMLLVAVSVVLGFVNITLEGRIIDDAVKGGNLHLLWKYVAVYLLIIAATSLMNYATEIYYTEITQKILIKLRSDIFNHVLRLDLGFYHKNSVGGIMSRIIPEIQQLGVFLSRLILTPLSCLITIVAGFGLITKIDWRLGLISMGIYLAVFFFLPKLREKLKDLTRHWSGRMRKVSHQTEEALSHFGEIQSNNTFSYEERRFENSLYDFFDIKMRIAKVFGKTSFLSGFFAGLAHLSVYAVGGYLIISAAGVSGGLTVGAIFIMIRALGTVISPINSLIDYFQRLQEAQVKFDMVTDYLNIPLEMTDSPGAKPVEKIEGGITAKRLSFGFKTGEKILRELEFEINPGEHVAVVGPAGCGKSTLTLLINRMIKPTEGRLEMDGMEISNITLDSFRRSVGYVPQAKTNAPVLFGGTLMDNVVYALKRKERPGDDCEGWLDLKSVGLKDCEELYDRVIEIIRQVGFYKDVLNFGLSNVTVYEAFHRPGETVRVDDPDRIRELILKGRSRFRERVQSSEKELIEFFDQDRYMSLSNVMENVTFTPAEPFLKSSKRYRELAPYLEKVCKKAGIYDRIFEMGAGVLAELSAIFKRYKKDTSTLARKLGFSPKALRGDLGALADKIKIHGATGAMDIFSSDEISRVLRIGYEYKITIGLDVKIDDQFKQKVLKAREIFRKELPEELKGLTFYDRDRYVEGASVKDNLVMGRINAIIYKADERINSVLRNVISDIGLEDEIVRLGLLMDIGERGARLSGGQSQKTALARVLLKDPDVLLLDEATSALDNESQRKINRLIREKFAGKTVVSVAHRLDTIKDYDRIMVLKSGELAESGDFDQLMKKKGLFCMLWETSFGKG